MERRPNAVRFAVLVGLLLPAVVGVVGPSLTTHAADDDWRQTCGEIDPPFDLLSELIDCLDAVIANIGQVSIRSLVAIIGAFTDTIEGIGQSLQDWGHRIHIKQVIQIGKIIERFAAVVQPLVEAMRKLIRLPSIIANAFIEAANDLVDSIQNRVQAITSWFRSIGTGIADIFQPAVEWLEGIQHGIEEAFGL